MEAPQKIAVIGLGRFGMALAKELALHGADVIAVDSDPSHIEEIRDHVPLAVILDSTDEAALRSQEIDRVDSVVIAIGTNFEAALLTTVLCRKNLQVPQVICRARTALHAEIFEQIGADEVINPERNSGETLGRRLAHPRIHDYINLAEGFSVIELEAPTKWSGQSLIELNLRSNYDVNLIAFRRKAGEDDEAFVSVPKPTDVIQESDILLLAGSEESLAGLPQS